MNDFKSIFGLGRNHLLNMKLITIFENINSVTIRNGFKLLNRNHFAFRRDAEKSASADAHINQLRMVIFYS